MRSLMLVLAPLSGAIIGVALAHWLGFDLLGNGGRGGAAVAAAITGLGAGAGLALARAYGQRQNRDD